jgi:hypothetical protein
LRPLPGDVVSVGDKASALKAGDTVVYSKFGIGVTDLQIKGEEFAVLKEEDILGVFPSSGAPSARSTPALGAGRAARGAHATRRRGALTCPHPTPLRPPPSLLQVPPPPTWASCGLCLTASWCR